MARMSRRVGQDQLKDRQPRPQDRAFLQPAVHRRRTVHEQAFLYVGGLDEVRAKAKEMAK